MTQPVPAHPLLRDVGGRPARPRRDGARPGGADRLPRAAGAALASAGPLLLYLALALCILWPYRSGKFRAAGDLNVVVGGIVEARNALAEGQFPVRVAPRQHDGARYPLFQFYANFPYTAAGALCLAGLSPYIAWRLVMLGALACGGLFVYRTGLYLTRSPLASAAGGVAFVAAPYMLTDLHARGAYAELIAFNLLPLALYACLRCLASRRRGWRYVPLAAVAWALVGLSHNITYLYGVIFVGLLLVTMLGARRQSIGRFGRLAVAGALHAGMMLWYVVPQVQLLPHIEMHGQTGSPFSPGALTGLATLLAPRLTNPPGSTTANLGLQVGWPVLGGALLALAGLILLRRRTPPRLRRVGWRLLAAFALAFFVAWSPIDFWQYLPKPLWFVQFTYRLLVFTTLFGALLVTAALAIWTNGLGERNRRWMPFVAVAGVALAAGSYVPRGGGKLDRTFVRQQLAHPTTGGLFDYLLAPTSDAGSTFAHAGVDLARPEFGLTRGDPWLRQEAGMRIGPVEGARGLKVKGVAPAGPVRLHVQLGGQAFVVRIGHGPFEFSIPLPQRIEAPHLAFRPLDEHGRFVRVIVESLRFEGAPLPGRPLVTADQVRPQARFGRVVKLRYQTNRPVLLQLPVLYYPGMLRVMNHGQPVAFGNVGRLLALELPPGRHRLEVELEGVRWANAASALTWAGVVLVPLAMLWRRRQGRGRVAPAASASHITQRHRTAAFGLRDAAAGCAAVLLGGGVALGGPWLAQRLGDPDAVHIACDAVAAEPQFDVANAFDGKLDTAWATKGWASAPPKLTITRERARPLRRVELVARETVLMETWHTVHVAASLHGWQVLDEVFSFPEAATQRTVSLDLDLPAVDRIELTFSDPVVRYPLGDGAERVSRDVVNPGYREIKLKWESEDED